MDSRAVFVEMLHSKIHRATVTDSDMNYVGSIGIDMDLVKRAKMLPGMKVDVLNITNGERFTTYVIASEPGSGQVCVNGAAARKVQKGDKVIIVAYASVSVDDASKLVPTVVFVDDDNSVTEVSQG